MFAHVDQTQTRVEGQVARGEAEDGRDEVAQTPSEGEGTGSVVEEIEHDLFYGVVLGAGDMVEPSFVGDGVGDLGWVGGRGEVGAGRECGKSVRVGVRKRYKGEVGEGVTVRAQ